MSPSVRWSRPGSSSVFPPWYLLSIESRPPATLFFCLVCGLHTVPPEPDEALGQCVLALVELNPYSVSVSLFLYSVPETITFRPGVSHPRPSRRCRVSVPAPPLVSQVPNRPVGDSWTVNSTCKYSWNTRATLVYTTHARPSDDRHQHTFVIRDVKTSLVDNRVRPSGS